MANFLPAIEYALQNEGQFQNDPRDSGNWVDGVNIGTNWGISGQTARDYGYTGDMRDLTREQAVDIYRERYWIFGGIQNQAIASKALDTYILSGTVLPLQQALNDIGADVDEDGAYGPQTQAAVNASDPSVLMSAWVMRLEDFYQNVAKKKNQYAFLDGWLARARRLPPVVAAGGIGFLLLLGVGLLLLARRSA